MKESINELQKIMDEGISEKKKVSPQKWAGFVESSVVNFFDEHKIEKLSIEDGNGNKAKLSRQRHKNRIFIDCFDVRLKFYFS